MTQRILFHPAPTAELVKNLKVETLGKFPKGTWLAADDATALELLKRDKFTAMLYPSREEYADAMEGLSEPQVAEAVNLRLQVWTAEAANRILPHLFYIEKKYLAKLASASLEPGSEATVLTAFYQREFEILNLILIDSRYHLWAPGKLMEAAFEELNGLNRDLESLEKRFGPTVQVRDADLIVVREALAGSLKKGMQKHGLRKGASSSGKVHTSLKRGVYITPMDDTIFKGIEEGHEPVQKWKDGFVTLWEDWDFPSLESRGRKVHILYLEESAFYRDYLSFTDSQRARQFSKRLKPIAAADLAAHLADRQLGLIMIESKAGPALEKSETAIALEISSHYQSETESLRSRLAIEFAAEPKSASKDLSTLESGEIGFSEVSFWLQWAQRNQWTDVIPELEKIHDGKRKFLDDLKVANVP